MNSIFISGNNYLIFYPGECVKEKGGGKQAYEKENLNSFFFTGSIFLESPMKCSISKGFSYGRI